MKIKFITALLALTLLFSTNATASFFTTTTMTTAQVVELVAKLSDDIGIMADRILLMADKIGEMADRIGEMADRIVHTEEMMADLTRDVAAINTPAQTSTVLITNTSYAPLSDETLPSFNVNSPAPQMLIYVSSTLTMNTDTVCVLVNSTQELASHWSQLRTLAKNNTIYIAIKTIDASSISSLSNVLTYTTLY